MFFSDRGWNDMACDYYRSWVCKIAKGKLTYVSSVSTSLIMSLFLKSCCWEGEGMFLSDRGWNDMACDYYRSWVCKIPKGKLTHSLRNKPKDQPSP